MKLLRERGLRVPDDVRVTGFNGLEFWRYAEPELTTVFSPAYAVGEAASEAMLARLRDGAFPFASAFCPSSFPPMDRPGPPLPAAKPRQTALCHTTRVAKPQRSTCRARAADKRCLSQEEVRKAAMINPSDEATPAQMPMASSGRSSEDV
jgi:hypothetical protein